MDLHTPRFTTRQTALAAGFEPSSFRNFLSRGQVALPSADAELAEGKGRANLFNLRMVYQSAVANRLIKAGAEPSAAFTAAAYFAHTGVGQRMPGHLFAGAHTLLVHFPETTRTRVVRADAKTAASLLFMDDNDTAQVVLAVLVNEVVAAVHLNLGIAEE